MKSLHVLLLCRCLLLLSVSLRMLGELAVGQSPPTALPGNSPPRPAESTVGDGWLPTGQWIQPAGAELTFSGRPNDLCYAPDSGLLFVKAHKQLRIVSAADWHLVQTLDCPGGASLTGMALDRQGRVYLSNAEHHVHVYAPSLQEKVRDTPHPTYELAYSLELPKGSFPCGVCLSADERQLFVCLSKNNAVAQVDLKSRSVARQVAVGIAPYEVILVPGSPDRLFVSNLGGRRAEADELTALSAGTETPVDPRGIANTSLVSVIHIPSWTVSGQVPAGLHATDLAVLPGPTSGGSPTVVVTNANDDSITFIDTQSLGTRTQHTKPLSDLPFGSMPNAVCLSPDGKLLFVALAGNNAIGVYSVEPSNTAVGPSCRPLGYLPTAWYPVAVTCSHDALLVANLKGLGSRDTRRPQDEGRNSHDHLGHVQKISLADIRRPEQLATWTESVLTTSALLPLAKQQQTLSVEPVPVPERLGDPSHFKHVIYVIKENRTYDQVFGDIEGARGDPQLCIFPEKNTPNHHALAKRFGLLDNYYCNGVLSADGHSWATEANVTPYLERAFGGFARSYTFGDDPLTYSSSGFLWDHVLAAGLSFRNYGEMDYAEPPEGMKYQEIWEAYQDNQPIEFKQSIGIDKLRRYSSRNYPGWNMMIPDVLRIDRFLAEFRQFERNGGLPNLCIVYLPQDHLGGGVTSAAHMADNDLALGRLVEAVSKSPYWKDTLIIANEDDPQNGFDHIDGHRSICLVISAYSRPGVNHSFYNQTSAVRTMLHVLGVPPMNQQDARSPLMTDCFQLEADLSAFNALEANFPLNEKPPEKTQQSAVERQWREVLATVPIQRTGMKSEQDEDNLNRFVWHEMRGWLTPYPQAWAGPHRRGLPALGLILDPTDAEE